MFVPWLCPDFRNADSIIPIAWAIASPVVEEGKTLQEQSRQGNTSDRFCRLYTLIIDALTDFPEYRSNIVELLKAIRNFPSPKYSPGQGLEWSELPHFA